MINVTKKYLLIIIILFLEYNIISVKSYSLDDITPFSDTDEAISDTVAVENFELDSSSIHTKLKIDFGHRSHPVNPYFRDEYRVIRDIRRLVRMFDRRVKGYESIDELFHICRSIPQDVQTKMIYTAFAGGVANFLCDITNKQLRKRKIKFFQWKLEKVVFRKKFKFIYAYIYEGMSTKGFTFRIPAIRFRYSRYSNKYYSRDNFTFWPTRYFGLSYSQWNQSRMITSLISTSLGYIAIGYDQTLRRLISQFELRKSKSIIIRLVHINYFERFRSNRLLSEVLIRL